MILAEIVLATRLLGLVADEQQIDIQVDKSVHSVAVLRDGRNVANIHQPPWEATVDFGVELRPHELTVVAYDAAGDELGRDTQAVNVARPTAEVGILLDRDAAGKVTARIKASHFAHRNPENVEVTLDGRKLRKPKKAVNVPLGVLDPSQIHVLGVELHYKDGVGARKEIVFGGSSGFSEQMPAELTPVAVRHTTEDAKQRADCFRSGETSLAATAVETGKAMALFVFNGGRVMVKAPDPRGDSLYALHGTEIHVVNPVPITVSREEGGRTGIFGSRIVQGSQGTRRAVMAARTPYGKARITDAVGVAAMNALRGGSRRVVVLVIGENPAADHSAHSPATVRRYLERVGVPLRVWSLTGPRPDLADTWGEVLDVSDMAKLLAATEDLRKELATQRVAWLPVPTLDAFRVTATADCSYTPLAIAR